MALFPYLASFWVDDQDNNVFVEIASVVDIGIFQLKIGPAQTTVLKSTDATRTYIPGFVDADEAKIRLRWRSGVYTTLSGYVQARAPKFWRFILPIDLSAAEVTAAQFDFFGFITMVGPPQFGAEEDKVIDLEVNLKLSGPIEYTPAT